MHQDVLEDEFRKLSQLPMGSEGDVGPQQPDAWLAWHPVDPVDSKSVCKNCIGTCTQASTLRHPAAGHHDTKEVQE